MDIPVLAELQLLDTVVIRVEVDTVGFLVYRGIRDIRVVGSAVIVAIPVQDFLVILVIPGIVDILVFQDYQDIPVFLVLELVVTPVIPELGYLATVVFQATAGILALVGFRVIQDIPAAV